jgi:hypothetical protein
MQDVLRRILSVPLAAVVLVYDGFSAVFGPLVRPVVAWAAELQMFRRIGRWIGLLPPYGALALLAVPFAAIEPFKVVALLWLAEGRFVIGLVTLVGAYLLSFLVCERIFHAGKNKLLRIDWFAWCYLYMVRVRARAMEWARSTAAWRWAAGAAESVRGMVRRAFSA